MELETRIEALESEVKKMFGVVDVLSSILESRLDELKVNIIDKVIDKLEREIKYGGIDDALEMTLKDSIDALNYVLVLLGGKSNEELCSIF